MSDCITRQEVLHDVCRRFGLQGEMIECVRLDSGHIHETYRMFLKRRGQVREYALQKVNTYVFKNPIAMMENTASVTKYLHGQLRKEGEKRLRHALQFCKTADGAYCVQTQEGDFWRCSHFIHGSISYEDTNDLRIVEESGKAYGAFARRLFDYPVEKLHIVIPHFHNTPLRYTALKNAVHENAMGRYLESEPLVSAYLEMEEIATRAYHLQRAGTLPLRVTHNDTKLSNVLFNRRTNAYLTVVDLDTVMPGLTAFDFGDAIRSGASTASEDEWDLEKVRLDMDKYRAFAHGYLSELGERLTKAELHALPLGAVAMTAECGVRFLTDYLNGDKYFRIHYAKQNFMRAQAQLQLAQDMLRRFSEMQSVVDAYQNIGNRIHGRGI